ncbi:hypothetical protein [Dactylosporangium sp. NPDC048998]|uniref:hypothetical protein n=1 Tax=Dactylosporangium sp. NPDC048998 TaxID=3363976 RepID=UPI00371C1A84
MNVDVIVGPGLVADLDLVRELAEAEFAGLGVDGAVREAQDLASALGGGRPAPSSRCPGQRHRPGG